MAVLQGVVQAKEDKTSKKGKQYLRLQINGEWWTSFARTYPQIGDAIEAATKPLGDGEIIDDLMIVGQGEQAAQAHSGAASAPPAPQHDRESYKQLSIMCQSAFTTIVNNSVTPADKPIATHEAMAKQAFKTAVFWDKKIKAYQGGLDVDAMKAGLNEDLSNQQSQDVGSSAPPSSEDFDDDIPF